MMVLRKFDVTQQQQQKTFVVVDVTQTKTNKTKKGKCLSEVTTVENRGNWLRLEKTLVALHAQNLSMCLPVY